MTLIIVLFDKVVTPETFHEEPHVVFLLNVVVPDINNVPLICVLPLF